MPYQIDTATIDSVELKALVVSRGTRVSRDVYTRFGRTHRLSPDPLQCNSLILPDGTIVQLTDLAFHMQYIRSAMSWSTLKQLRYLTQLQTPFSVELDDGGEATLFHDGRRVTPVSFPAPTDFYKQRTTSGLPYVGNAVLQGTQWLSFQLLWKCDYAWAGQPCQYCYSGGELRALAGKRKPVPTYPGPEDVARSLATRSWRKGVLTASSSREGRPSTSGRNTITSNASWTPSTRTWDGSVSGARSWSISPRRRALSRWTGSLPPGPTACP